MAQTLYGAQRPAPLTRCSPRSFPIWLATVQSATCSRGRVSQHHFGILSPKSASRRDSNSCANISDIAGILYSVMNTYQHGIDFGTSSRPSEGSLSWFCNPACPSTDRCSATNLGAKAQKDSVVLQLLHNPHRLSDYTSTSPESLLVMTISRFSRVGSMSTQLSVRWPQVEDCLRRLKGHRQSQSRLWPAYVDLENE